MKPAEVPLLWIVVSTRSRLSAFSCAAADAPSSASTRSAARIFTQPERSALAKEELSGAGRPLLSAGAAHRHAAPSGRSEHVAPPAGRPERPLATFYDRISSIVRLLTFVQLMSRMSS